MACVLPVDADGVDALKPGVGSLHDTEKAAEMIAAQAGSDMIWCNFPLIDRVPRLLSGISGILSRDVRPGRQVKPASAADIHDFIGMIESQDRYLVAYAHIEYLHVMRDAITDHEVPHCTIVVFDHGEAREWVTGLTFIPDVVPGGLASSAVREHRVVHRATRAELGRRRPPASAARGIDAVWGIAPRAYCTVTLDSHLPAPEKSLHAACPTPGRGTSHKRTQNLVPVADGFYARRPGVLRGARSRNCVKVLSSAQCLVQRSETAQSGVL